MIDFIKTAVLFLFLFSTFIIQAQSSVNTDNITHQSVFSTYGKCRNDTTICRGSNYQLHGSAYLSEFHLLEYFRRRVFQQSFFISRQHIFHGFNDMNSGSVTLTLSAFPIPPETFVASDFMILTIEQASHGLCRTRR